MAYGVDCDSLGEKLRKIETVPFKGEPVEDKYYNEIVNQSDDFVTCFAEQIENTSPMKDPRKCPPYNNFLVGDLAYMLFIRQTGISFDYFFPIEVQIKYKDQGIYAYFAYVEKPQNRKELAEKCQKWCEENLNELVITPIPTRSIP